VPGSPPSLRVCLVTYRSGHVVGRTLAHLREAVDRAGVDCTLSVVDNASDDDSLQRVEAAWPGAGIVRNPANRGYAAAINQAAQGADTDWLLFLNPDTFVDADLLEGLGAAHDIEGVSVFSPLLVDQSGDRVRTAYTWPTLGRELARLFGAGAVVRRARRPDYDGLDTGTLVDLPEPLRRALRVDYAAGACLFVRTEAWRSVGPFDEGYFMYHEEMEWALRAARRGIGVFVLPDRRAVHLRAGSSRQRPVEIAEWRQRGLLHFFATHHPGAGYQAYRLATALTYGARALASRAVAPERARAYGRIARSALSR
jgi:N-acetylglucosaminyl-diphospho-decaprenol L-rhamnosyltransferase